jgi:hypothetical protein
MLLKELMFLRVSSNLGNELEVTARLENLNYKATLFLNLKEYCIDKFLSEELRNKASFILNYKDNRFGVSQWKTPKRTRTYPYARVYDTMGLQTRITLIPFVKNEGFDGDQDYLQWDTVSLMSLLNVYVIIGYYSSATKNPNYENKITNQVMDYRYLTEQIDELVDYKSSALHWNLNQLEKCHYVAEKAKENYQRISKELNIKLHSLGGIDERIKVLNINASAFKKFSRKMSAKAQNREFQTMQPKENLIENKAKLTVQNYLGGEYHFTIDELKIDGDSLVLMEKKNSNKSKYPNISDIKDGFVKLMLFTNLKETRIGSKPYKKRSALGLTSSAFIGYCHSLMTDDQIKEILKSNHFSAKQQKTLLSVLNEGRINNFLIFLMDNNHPEYQNEILSL